jgi:hypothetical protein
MKKLLTLFAAVVLITHTVGAASFTPATLKASEIVLPLGNTGKKISLQDLATISVKDFGKLIGKKMSFADRMMFKVAQRKIRHSINEDGTVNSRKIERVYKKYDDGDSGFNLGGFALGFLLGLIGVLIAYIINNDNNHSRRIWAWIGWGVFVVLYLGLYLALK